MNTFQSKSRSTSFILLPTWSQAPSIIHMHANQATCDQSHLRTPPVNSLCSSQSAEPSFILLSHIQLSSTHFQHMLISQTDRLSQPPSISFRVICTRLESEWNHNTKQKQTSKKPTQILISDLTNKQRNCCTEKSEILSTHMQLRIWLHLSTETSRTY